MIAIYLEEFPDYDVQPGDLISGIYIRKNYYGQFYRVVSILINNE